jgi:hypothetical protein
MSRVWPWSRARNTRKPAAKTSGYEDVVCVVLLEVAVEIACLPAGEMIVQHLATASIRRR